MLSRKRVRVTFEFGKKLNLDSLYRILGIQNVEYYLFFFEDYDCKFVYNFKLDFIRIFYEINVIYIDLLFGGKVM